jgi:phospholipid transport system transporter-binding protein
MSQVDAQIRLTKTSEYHYQLTGSLSFKQVAKVINLLDIAISSANNSDLSVDLSGITHSDSAGLALLVEWLRRARSHSVRLVFLNLPKQLREIARISALLPILSLE